MRAFLRAYGANPLHLLALLASFAICGYAASKLVDRQSVRVVVWFVVAAVGHDLLLLPLYVVADSSLARGWRHFRNAVRRPAAEPREPDRSGWVNYVRFPAAISLLLLLVFLPEVTRRATALRAVSTESDTPYLAHWLLVSGILFAVSAVLYALRLARRRRAAAGTEGRTA